MKAIIKRCIEESIQVKQQILEDEAFLSRIQQAVDRITQSFRAGHKVWFCGNGGSAADAQHLAAEFSGRFYLNRKALPAEAFHCNTSYLTAVANDYHFDDIYSRLIEGLTQKGDIIIGLSTSGNSRNIVKGFQSARTMGVTTIGFTGASGGELKALSDLLFNVPATDTPRIQESHILVGHIICQLVEAKIFGS
ncbi:MAG TPA: D-sedoheptulose 7-phosphate isomerase [Arachidicoccus sp.]|nr:D-sedoheptulose 7-phosphate isomerase [Arachidicoccus sp.]